MPETAKISNAAPAAQEKTTGLLDQIVEQGRFTRDRERGRDLVKEFVDQIVKGHMTVSKDTETAINARIAEIDKLISDQLNEVLHHPEFQKLEGTWRGLKYLLDQSETNENLRIKILNARKTDLLRDLERASEFDQSALFKKVYEEEFGVFGGAPFAALVGDYEFGPGPQDMDLLERIAQVAASAHAPFLSAASPEMLNLTDFTTRYRPQKVSVGERRLCSGCAPDQCICKVRVVCCYSRRRGRGLGRRLTRAYLQNG